MRTYTWRHARTSTLRPIPSWTVAAAVISAAAISCGGEDQNAADNSPVSGVDPATGAGAGAGTGAGTGTGTTTSPTGTTTTGGGAPSCPTYDDDFLPQVHVPVCSKCHGADPKLPDWGVYATASGACSLIGSQVGANHMPPASSGLSLTSAERTTVLDWVRIGCPKTKADTPASCRVSSGAPPPNPTGSPSPTPTGSPSPTPTPQPTGNPPNTTGDAGAPGSPGTTDRLSITRAEWRSETGTLRLEGTCSNYTASLTAEFGGRREALLNASGRFRSEFSSVTTKPATVTVTASTGASATSAVQAN
jgi:hypothetical protein